MPAPIQALRFEAALAIGVGTRRLLGRFYNLSFAALIVALLGAMDLITVVIEGFGCPTPE